MNLIAGMEEHILSLRDELGDEKLFLDLKMDQLRGKLPDPDDGCTYQQEKIKPYKKRMSCFRSHRMYCRRYRNTWKPLSRSTRSNMIKVQTDNSHFEVKVKLREDNLPAGPCRVLDCYGGTGRIWNTIKQHNPKKKIRVLRIDKKKNRGGVYLVGDNSKFMEALDRANSTL